MRCFHVSDLHGRRERYVRLFRTIRDEQPDVLFIGGDFLPSGGVDDPSFIDSFFGPELSLLRQSSGKGYPRVLVIFGNDDLRAALPAIETLEREGLVELVHERSVSVGRWRVVGYPYVPPTPFLLKDWERYDVARHIEPGCISPEEGVRSIPVDQNTSKYATIQADLDRLSAGAEIGRSIWLFHAPPYQTRLDRAALDGKSFDHVLLDVHVGSIAIRRFIETKQPCLTMHGHIHESAHMSGSWRDRIGETHLLGAAHHGPELSLVRFDPDDPASASRELID